MNKTKAAATTPSNNPASPQIQFDKQLRGDRWNVLPGSIGIRSECSRAEIHNIAKGRTNPNPSHAEKWNPVQEIGFVSAGVFALAETSVPG